MMKDEDGKWVIAKPSIGTVAFDLIQGQIEGTWPKGRRKHYAITRTNLTEWLARHKGAELKHLRLLATTESLTSIAHDIADQGFTKGNQQSLEFLTSRLRAVSIAFDDR
jgi:predicted RNase H-like HicB family nuclease